MTRHPKPIETQERDHDQITSNLIQAFETALVNKPCYVYSSQMRVRVSPTGRYTNPDVTIVCGERQWEDESQTAIINPTVIIEVLTEATELEDRSDKHYEYREMPSLREHLLVPHDVPWIFQYSRYPDGQWYLRFYDTLDDTLALPAIDCSIPFREIYRATEVMDYVGPGQTVHHS